VTTVGTVCARARRPSNRERSRELSGV
jgi:hypothetical protein